MAYVALKDELGPRAKLGDKDARKKQIISKFAMGTFTSEVMFLRLVKTAAALLNISVKKEKPSSKSKSKQTEKLNLTQNVSRSCVKVRYSETCRMFGFRFMRYWI